MALLRQPYSDLARSYDRALGVPFFRRTRRAFETLVRRYGIVFRSAADVGCGTGLFACYLNRRWRVPVFAVDRSAEMLEVGRCNCPGPGVCFMQQDVRRLCLPHPVDLITANFDALNHLLNGADLRAAFRSTRDNLNPGGHFIFDIVTPCQRWRRYTRWLPSHDGELLQRACWSRDHDLLKVMMIHRRPLATTIELHAERAYDPLEAARWLQAAGFEVRGIHDAESVELAAVCPPRAILVARIRPSGAAGR